MAPLPGTRPTSNRSISPVDRFIFAIPVKAFGSDPGLVITCQFLASRRSGGRQVAAVIDVRNIQRVSARMICRGPVTSRIPVTNDMMFARLLEHYIPVQGRLAGLRIEVGNNEVRIVIWKWCGPTETGPWRGRAQRFRAISTVTATSRSSPFLIAGLIHFTYFGSGFSRVRSKVLSWV